MHGGHKSESVPFPCPVVLRIKSFWNQLEARSWNVLVPLWDFSIIFFGTFRSCVIILWNADTSQMAQCCHESWLMFSECVSSVLHCLMARVRIVLNPRGHVQRWSFYARHGSWQNTTKVKASEGVLQDRASHMLSFISSSGFAQV